MKDLFVHILGIFLIGTSSCLYAADQKDCLKQVEEQFKEIGNTISSYAGTAEYKKIHDQALQCFNSGRCGKADVMLGTQEMMVDEIVVSVQREKLTRLRVFITDLNKRKNPNDLCSIANSFPALIADLKMLNDRQLERFGQLAQRNFGAQSGEVRLYRNGVRRDAQPIIPPDSAQKAAQSQ